MSKLKTIGNNLCFIYSFYIQMKVAKEQQNIKLDK